MRIRRLFTVEGKSPYEGISFHAATSEIRNPDGSVVFRQEGIEVPASWSQVACDVMAQKYFRRAGMAVRMRPVEEKDVPSFLWRQVPDKAALDAMPENEKKACGEISAKQVFHRLAGTWAYWGWKGGYFDAEDDAREKGLETASEAKEGDASKVLVELAEKHDADILVIGNKGMKRKVLGSVPNTVSHNAGCSVLIVKTT